MGGRRQSDADAPRAPGRLDEWTIAAYVPGLELTTADTAAVAERRRR